MPDSCPVGWSQINPNLLTKGIDLSCFYQTEPITPEGIINGLLTLTPDGVVTTYSDLCNAISQGIAQLPPGELITACVEGLAQNSESLATQGLRLNVVDNAVVVETRSGDVAIGIVEFFERLKELLPVNGGDMAVTLNQIGADLGDAINDPAAYWPVLVLLVAGGLMALSRITREDGRNKPEKPSPENPYKNAYDVSRALQVGITDKWVRTREQALKKLNEQRMGISGEKYKQLEEAIYQYFQ